MMFDLKYNFLKDTDQNCQLMVFFDLHNTSELAQVICTFKFKYVDENIEKIIMVLRLLFY